MIELVIRFYLGVAFAGALYAFCLCGAPEIARRGVLDDRSAPVWQHAVMAVFISALVGLSWPQYFWDMWKGRA